jgi:hypothetical protein
MIKHIIPRGRTQMKKGTDGHRQLEEFMKARMHIPDGVKFEYREKRNGQIARFDVIDTVNKLTIDNKFGNSLMSQQQFSKYREMHGNNEILTIHPNGQIYQYHRQGN